jgi:hypothetical protein
MDILLIFTIIGDTLILMGLVIHEIMRRRDRQRMMDRLANPDRKPMFNPEEDDHE